MRAPDLAIKNGFSVIHATDGDRVALATVDKTAAPYIYRWLSHDVEDGFQSGVVYASEDIGNPLALLDREDLKSDAFLLSDAFQWFGLTSEPAFVTDPSRFTHLSPNKIAFLNAVFHNYLGLSEYLALKNHLDLDVVSALSADTSFSARDYNFYADPSKRDIRLQAARSYPIFARHMAARPLLKFKIDLQQPLADALITSFGATDDGDPILTKSILKRFQSSGIKSSGVPIETLLQAAHAVPPDWLPTNPDEMNAFAVLADRALTHFASETGLSVTTLIKGAGGKWSDFLNRCAKGYADTFPPEGLSDEEKANWSPIIDPSLETLNSALIQTLDMIKYVRDALVLPLSGSSGDVESIFIGAEDFQVATRTAAALLLSEKNLPSIFEVQRRFHIDLPKIMESCVEISEEFKRRTAVADIPADAWPPLCDIHVAPNGVTIFPLITTEELKNEGKDGRDPDGNLGLKHCVGGYSAQCLAGTSHIVSFRNDHGNGKFERLSTAEFSLDEGEKQSLRLRQNRGFKNGNVPPRAQQAYDWFIESVSADRIILNKEKIRYFRTTPSPARDEIERACHYDWRTDHNIEVNIDALREYLPKDLRLVDIDAMRYSRYMEDLNEKIHPSFRRLVGI